jgi:hypothetical protein
MRPLLQRIRSRRRTGAAGAHADGRAHGQLLEELPEEDLAAELADTLDLYRTGGKPEPEEAEYVELLQDAVARMAQRRS